MGELIGRALRVGADPGDDEELRLRKILLLSGAYVILPLAALWGLIYIAGGAPGAGLIPLTYAGLSLLSIGIFAVVRTYWWFGLSQLALYTALPFVLMWALGGFVEGSVVGLFASAAPIGALLLGHRRLAPVLLLIYVALMVMTPAVVSSGVFDGLAGDKLSPALVTTYFVMNLAGVPVITWLLVRVFSGGREGMLLSVRGVVRHYLSPVTADLVLTDPRRQELGGEIAEVTVLFADLGGYSTYAESRPPTEVVALLNRYFALILPAILDESGTPIQLPGDAVMAVFGAPIPHADHPIRACRAARRMRDAIEAEVAGSTEPDSAPRFRIGVNTGPGLVGNIGSEEFRNFTVIGDTTNVAQRLQASAAPASRPSRRSMSRAASSPSSRSRWISGSPPGPIMAGPRENAVSRQQPTTPPPGEGMDEEFWRHFLEEGGDSWKGAGRRVLRRIPADPRCRMCAAPFAGPGAPIMRMMGKRPSEANPNWCTSCYAFITEHRGGAEIDGAMLFADIRGSTALAERMTPAEYHALLDRYLAVATDVVFKHDGAVDKFVGDELVAMFFPLLTGERYVARTVEAAQELLRATGHTDPDGPWVAVGVGVHAGRAWFGVVGEGRHLELTAVGDNVNIAARLASLAQAGEVLVSADAATRSGLDPALERRTLELKGKEQATEVVSVRVSP